MVKLNTQSMGFDAESRMVSWADSGTGASVAFAYDGEGRRVTKTAITSSGAAAVTTTYVYDPEGQLAVEYGGAVPAVTGPVWLTTDHLGSTRLVTSTTGCVGAHDYLPFGEEIAGAWGRNSVPCYGASDTRWKFGGQQRDTETAADGAGLTGLDNFLARHMAPPQGRFLSPDSDNAGANPADPQSWNMYSYALNNPLAFIDPSGMACVSAGADNGTTDDYEDPTNYIDDNRGGSTCAQAFASPPQTTTVYGGQNAAIQETEDAVTSFLTGQAPDEIVYSSEDPFVQSFKTSAGMDAIVAGIRKTCRQTGSVAVGSAEAFANTLIDGILGGAGFLTAEAQLGAFFAAFSRSGGLVNITVTNPISRNSLLYHVPAHVGLKDPKKGPLKTVNQTLHVTAADPCNGRPVG